MVEGSSPSAPTTPKRPVQQISFWASPPRERIAPVLRICPGYPYLFSRLHLLAVVRLECARISEIANNVGPFDSLRASLATLAVPSVIIDGEIIVLDNRGVSHFNSLLTEKGREMAVFYAFDLVWLNGNDFRRTPLIERKAMLSEFVRRSRCPRLVYAQHIDGTGKQFFREICARDLEGVVGKRKNGWYRDDRPDWIKIKNRAYSQADGRHELFTQRGSN